ncbi:MAG: aldo/keto reductase [Candidatus Caldarchaeum sp.]
MRFVELGRTGLRVSSICLGTWQFGSGSWGFGREYSRNDCLEAVRASLEAGVNFIDTAEIYGGGVSEQIVGEALRDVDGEVFIATKVWPTHLTYNGVIKACGRSLQRLGVRTIDLYQIHFPNPLIPLRQTMRAMEDLVRMGKVRFIGVSNFPLRLLKKAREYLKTEDVVSNQVKYNLIERNIEKDLLPYCEREKITILAYSPLAQGLLTGKYSRKHRPRDYVRRINRLYTPAFLRRAEKLFEELEKIAGKHGVSMGQIALAWVAGHQRCVAVAGAKNRHQALENALAGDVMLSGEEMMSLSQLSEKVKPTAFDMLRTLTRIFNP